MIRATKNYAYTWKNVSYVGSVYYTLIFEFNQFVKIK